MPPLKNYNFNETSESTHIKRILAFGDSLTEGFLSGGRKFYPYTTKLEEKLNAHFNWTRFEVLNEGISGECVFTEMVTRLPKILARIGNRVNLVIILGGTSDFHKLNCLKRVNVAHEVITLHKIVHKAGLKSVLVTIPECSLGKKCDKARMNVNDKLRGWAMEHKKNTLLCDLGNFMPLHNMSRFDRKVFWDDEIHPSRVGYDKIAAILFHTIREELEPPVLNGTIIDIPSHSKADKIAPHPKRLKSSRKHKKKTHKTKRIDDKRIEDKHLPQFTLVSAATPGSTFSPNDGLPSNSASTTFSASNTAAISALPSISGSTSSSTASNSALPSTNPTFAAIPSFNYTSVPYSNYTQVPSSNTTYATYNQYSSSNGTYGVHPNTTLPSRDANDAGDLHKELPDYYISQH